MKSVFFIPTNRSIKDSVSSYIKEILYANDVLQVNIPLIVVETNEFSSIENNEIIKSLKNQYPKLNILHLSVDVQKKYFKSLFKGMDDDFYKIFTYTGTDYATAMNKLGLFACSMGANAYHRRDSDTCLLFDRRSEAREVYPIEYELKYLGKPIMEIVNDLDIKNLKQDINNKRRILVVGGNYLGEWNLDVKDFAKVSYDYVYKIYELLGFKSEHIIDICDDIFKLEQPVPQNDVISLVTSVDDGCNPDCGNVSVYRLFEFLPNLPGKNTLAADYFAFDTSTALGYPSVHHTRPVFHEYHDERFEYDKKLKYWYGMLKFADYFSLYGSIYNDKLIDNFCDYDDCFVSQQMCESLSEKIALFASNDTKREEHIIRIIDEVLLKFDENYSKIGQELRKVTAKCIAECNEEYLLHANLLNNWNKIIEQAKKMNLMDFIVDD